MPISRIPMKSSRTDEVGRRDPIENAKVMFHATTNSSYQYLLEEPQLMDCFICHPSSGDEDRYRWVYHTRRDYEAQDQTLMDAVATQSKLITKQLSENSELVYFSNSEGRSRKRFGPSDRTVCPAAVRYEHIRNSLLRVTS
jgi:hypothetical protein